MSVNFFQNGASIGSSAGWGGYTGSNNYVVRYDFVTGIAGASAVSITLSNIYYGTNAGTQAFGFKISTSAAAYANIRAAAPDSAPGYMSYSGANGYCCTLSAAGLNLAPNTRYYLFVYVVGSGAEYYTGWNCTAPLITASGSYNQPRSTISSVSPQVNTLGAVSVIMARAGSCWHKARFLHSGEELAVSAPFAASLSYICPRAWMEKDTSSLELSVTVSVQSYNDEQCTSPTGEPDTAQFILTADAGMHPVLAEGAAEAQVLNVAVDEKFTEFIAGISRARVSFDAEKIDLAACAGAQIAAYKLRYKGRTISAQASPVDTGVLNGDCTIVCTVIDTRGREGSTELDISMLPYVPPSLTGIEVLRCSSKGITSARGMSYKIKATLNYTPLGGKNEAKVWSEFRYADQRWKNNTELTGFESGVWSDNWAQKTVLGGTLVYDSYTVRFTVEDLLGSRVQYIEGLYSSAWALKLNSNGTAIGFGMAPTAANAVQMPATWSFYPGSIILSAKSYGTAPPESAITSPAEGQLYFHIQDA